METEAIGTFQRLKPGGAVMRSFEKSASMGGSVTRSRAKENSQTGKTRYFLRLVFFRRLRVLVTPASGTLGSGTIDTTNGSKLGSRPGEAPASSVVQPPAISSPT